MTTTTNLIELAERLRCFDRVTTSEAADLLEAQAAQIEALQADAARLEHLCKSVRCASANIDGKHSWNFLHGHGWSVGATFREAIDAAHKGNV